MVQQTKFWGIPIKTQRQRRLLVVGYYLLFTVMAGVGFWLWPKFLAALVQLAFVMAILLGGISYDAPVKAYERLPVPFDQDGPQTLNLSGRRESRRWWSPLDERERVERDHAHYTAYRILRWTLGVVALGYGLSLTWTYPSLGKELPVLVWMLVVYVLSLPQAVVLWTEPEGPAEELSEVRSGAR
ncbi:MAG: hypothetical protein WBY53_19255 [Acidobacteriaceae bacterium]